MAQLNPAIEYVRSAGDLVDIDKLKRLITEEPIIRSFEYVYTTVGAKEAQKMYSMYVSGDGLREQFESFMKKYVADNTAGRVTAITGITKERAADVIRKTLAGDLSAGTDEMGRVLGTELKKQGARMSTWRARVIARTEVVSSFNIGQQVGMEQTALDTGLQFNKTWLATMDNRVRDRHANKNGQTAALDGFFIFDNGDMMKTPGDPSGSAENVINCRCALTYDKIM